MEKIKKIAKKLNIKESNLECFGEYKAKIKNLKFKEKGNLILVTSINPTKNGEGKTTVSVGLADALSKLKKKVCLTLREPSLGPVFGLKGGATGGGKAVVEPSEEINLHFTGDFHAITSANNLLCAMIDNHIFQGNELDFKEVVFNRCIDMNDRALREITINEEKLKNNKPRKEHFVITPASEIMAIFCLAKNEQDLKEKLGRIVVGYNSKEKPIYASDLKAENAMFLLLKEAFYPNLVQTKEGTPAIIHGGPFANIAHGCNSVVATKTALSYADFVVTEAGFGADLGAEKFFDLKCRENNLNPKCVVIVVTVKALKEHSEDLSLGLENLGKHISNIKNVFNKSCVVALNFFENDSQKDIEKVKKFVENLGVGFEVCSPYLEGGEGCKKLAKKVLENFNDNKLTFSYNLEDNIEKKIEDIAKKVYGAISVKFSEKSLKNMKKIEKIAKNYPVVIAKTQYSLSCDDNLKGAPKDFVLDIEDIELKNGAGFVLAICGKIMLMPGLPKHPNAENI